MNHNLEWKQHQKYPRFTICENGDIWDLKKDISKRITDDKANGVMCVCLEDTKRKQLNRVVYETFIGEIEPNAIIRHQDKDYKNNHHTNLYKCSRSVGCRRWKQGKGYSKHTEKKALKDGKIKEYTKYRAHFRDNNGEVLNIGCAKDPAGARRIYVKYAYEFDSQTYDFLKDEYDEYFGKIFNKK
tara:strand:- start:2639 stop:3193 length:555 start_codon:yes stop_codon:yes gene_type:complete